MSDFSLSFDGKDGGTIRVDAEVSVVSPEQCTFKVTETLYPEHSAHFSNKEQSQGSPLIDKLFDLGNVNDVLVSNDKLTINLNSGTWEDTVPNVGAAIHAVLTSGGAPISEAVTSSLLPPDEVKSQVQKILDDLVNPAVASHGGFVNLVDVSENNVVLEFGGGCQGCGMANVTLKYGVERTIREHVPGVGQIMDTTDHATGANPYYK
jgi:Fe-S cluster biogenesis protein NfuA